MTNSFIRKCQVNTSVEALSKWHHSEDVFNRIQPPWESAKIVKKAEKIANGLEEHIQIKMGPLKKLWIARYQDVIENQQFCDLQVKGPFGYWLHRHIFHDNGDGSSTLEDNITYAPPLGKVGDCLAGGLIASKLDKMFKYRHLITKEDIERHHTVRVDKHNILISGGTGLIGQQLSSLLTSMGHNVYLLTRNPKAENHIHWSYKDRIIEIDKLSKMDTVINLSGASIAGLWTKKHKGEIYRSRVEGTSFLVESLLKHSPKLKTFLSASGSGAYPLNTGQKYDEAGPLGNSFLGEVARDWERASYPLQENGVRVAHFRIGVVISRLGGALQKLLMPSQFCLGGPWGNGQQHMSWISISDLVDIFTFAVSDKKYTGVINAVASDSIQVNSFFKILGKVLKKPQALRVPAFIMKSLPNNMGREIFLGDNIVDPAFLRHNKYKYRHNELESCLRFELGYF